MRRFSVFNGKFCDIIENLAAEGAEHYFRRIKTGFSNENRTSKI